MMLSAEELLAGSGIAHEVEIPAELFNTNGDSPTNARIVLRPLTVRDLQRIGKATRDDDSLSSAGLARFLIEQINTISGISTPRNELEELVQAPLARACFVLAKEFGWTPEQVSGMTIGQILLYLEMAQGRRDGG